jgi:hypothetical protein
MSVTCTTYAISQGESLEVPLLVLVNGQPADLTNVQFYSTLKTDPNLPDSDPTVVFVDWVEGSNPASGLTKWVVAPVQTQHMAVATWRALIRASNVPGLPSVSDLVEAVVIVHEPVSSRITPLAVTPS